MFKRIKQWMYRDNRPNWIAQIANRVWAWVGSSGLASNYVVTLEVIGRKSGRIISFPVIVAYLEGERYVVSMLGNDAQWVRNVHAADGKAYVRSGPRKEVRLEEVPPAQRPPILKAYLQRASGARPHIPVDKDAPVADFEPIAADYPAFRVVVIDG